MCNLYDTFEDIIFIRNGVFLLLAAVVIKFSVEHNHLALRKTGCVRISLFRGALGARSKSDAWRADWAVL